MFHVYDELSKYILFEIINSKNLIKKGDLIFTGTPAGVAKVKAGDHLEGYLENEKLLDFFVR